MAEALDGVREALLGYYKDQLVSHATILLTLGLLFFTAFEALKEAALLRSPVLSLVATVGIWQLLRFMYYGRLAGCIMYAKPEDRIAMGTYWQGIGKDKYAEATDMHLLHSGAEKIVRDKRFGYGWLIHLFATPTKLPVFLVYVAICFFFFVVLQVSWPIIATT